MQPPRPDKKAQTPDACPHCGEKLSPWQQVLLSVDRALMCKNCWYRIIADVYTQEPDRPVKKSTNSQERR